MRDIICVALRTSLKEGYHFSLLKKDLLAGLVVSLVALPLSMAFSIAVGLPPQHGLITAIVAGSIVPILGGSRFQVSGFTAAFIAILIPIIVRYGLAGLMIITIISGFLLVLLGISRAGRYIVYIPHVVVIGFTAGIALTIGTLSLNDFFGLNIPISLDSYCCKLICIVKHMPKLCWCESAIGTLTLFVMWYVTRFIPKIPAPLIGIGIATCIAMVLQSLGYDISTIGTHFVYQLSNGEQGYGIPPLLPTLLRAKSLIFLPSFDQWGPFFIAAGSLTLLSALESLLSARIADQVTGTKHNPNVELIGIGVGNILSGLAGGLPATGAFARTAKNIRNGAQTPFAAFFHGVFVLLYVVLFATVLSHIPMAALAALLMRAACHMFHYRELMVILSTNSWQDSAALLVCFFVSVFGNMIMGVMVGLVLFYLLKLIFRERVPEE